MYHLVQFYWHTFKLCLISSTHIMWCLGPVNFQSADQDNHHEIINTGEHQSALNYPDQLIENLLDRDDHIICVLLIKHSLKVCQYNCTRWYIVLTAWLFYCMNTVYHLYIFCDTHRWPDLMALQTRLFIKNKILFNLIFWKITTVFYGL